MITTVFTMLVQKDLMKLFQQLIHDESVHFNVDGIDILIRVFDNSSKLFLTTPVFIGGNFIPKSVRQCLSQKAPFYREDQIKTYLTVDEERYQVFLNCISVLEACHNGDLKNQLEEFSWLADQWRNYLEEHGKNDLIHVRVK